jgi:predicted nuclease with TOPRIM domain
MTEEEYFRKNYPDFCYGDRPLSPYWDFFQDGVEFGERQSEKKIEELELELTVEKDQHQEEINLHLHAEEYIKSLEKENAELKEELKNWKDEWQEQVQKAIDEGYARTQQTIQLTKATEILRSLYFIIQSRIDYKNNIEIADEMWRVEQFMKKIEK